MKLDEQQEHNLICDTGTSIDRMKKEVIALKEMIEGYATYTRNTSFLANLRNLQMRMLNEINKIDKNFNVYVDYNESLKK